MSELTLAEQAALEGVTPKAIYMRRWREKNPDYNAVYLRNWNRARRERVLKHYGGSCACCGESTYEFLAIDHLDGGGERHRAEVGQGSHMVTWLIDNNLPDGFRVLCHNCNQAIGYYGECSHSRELRLVVGRDE